MTQQRIAGIIGGLGPQATVFFMQQIIQKTPATDDAAHIHMIIDNNPHIPSRIKAIIEKTGEDPTPALMEAARRLERAGAHFLAMPCNTAHFYHRQIQSSVSIPFINMVELVSKTIICKQPDITRVGLLASNALQIIHLYEPFLERHNIKIVYPPAGLQAGVMNLIKAVKAGQETTKDVAAVNQAIEALEADNVGALIIACTELSVMANRLRAQAALYDASDILANEVLRQVRDS
ncbi:MAG: amino acid racemase [Spirochaetota bacterium]